MEAWRRQERVRLAQPGWPASARPRGPGSGLPSPRPPRPRPRPGSRSGRARTPWSIAPTGSGKTLAAFLWAIDKLATEPVPANPRHRCRVLYISPMKALAVDVERNLRSPLTGVRGAARRLGLPEPDITVAVRTGDTAADERRKMSSKPPDILITTPESLFLLLTSQARESLRGVETVIVDEVHALAGGKRGAHLALSLERLDALRMAGQPQPAQSQTAQPPSAQPPSRTASRSRASGRRPCGRPSGSGCRPRSGRRRRSPRSSVVRCR